MKLENGRGIVSFSAHIIAATLSLGLMSASFAEDATEMTRSQHEELAVSYENEVKELQSQVERHEKMQNMYAQIHGGHKHGGGKAALSHCKNLADNYRAAAENASELAKIHRAMATEAQP